MKLSSCLPLLTVLVSAMATQAQLSLQAGIDAVAAQARELTLQDDIDRMNANMLNYMIGLALPGINSDIRLRVPDPLTNNQTGTYDIGTRWIPLWCREASFHLDFTVGEIVGLSELRIDSMIVETGSVRVNHQASTWTGNLILAVDTPGMIMANDFQGQLRASCAANGNENTWSIGGQMLAVEPTLNGQVNLAGNLCGASCMQLETAEIPNSMGIDYQDFLFYVDESPWWVPGFVVERVVWFMTRFYKESLVSFVDVRMRPFIVDSLLAEMRVLRLA